MKLKNFKADIVLTLVIIILFQIGFSLFASDFTKPKYESKIYATTGVKHDTSDLHKLNEAAHYFGQTMIGWTKFPNFMNDLNKQVNLPEGASLNAHIQERQNIIFTVSADAPLEEDVIIKVKDYIQGKIDEYNNSNTTNFLLSNTDYEEISMQKTYTFGALIALMASLVISTGVLFIRYELFRK